MNTKLRLIRSVEVFCSAILCIFLGIACQSENDGNDADTESADDDDDNDDDNDNDNNDNDDDDNDDDNDSADDDDDDDTDPPEPSEPEDGGDLESVDSFREWYLIGNDLTPGHDALELVIDGSDDDTEYVDAWIDGEYAGRFEPDSGKTTVDPSIEGLDPDEHEVLLSADGSVEGFLKLSFWRSHPIYVLMTNDWDTADNTDDALSLQEDLHEAHPEMKMTHFVGPYTYTDTSITADRVELLTNWVLDMRDTYDDEIGLHVHPYCNFVETTTVTCRTSPSFSSTSDETGYSVVLSSYTEQEATILFEKAVEIFEDNGLGTPTSFRAGGWTAQIHTMKALEAAGFLADSSANNWAKIEEWENHQDATIYQWCEENWSSIGDTSQPYYPSEADILSPGTPQVNVLEVPDNGCLVDYVSGPEMIAIFEANWSGEALEEPKTYVFGYHPTNFSNTYFLRLQQVMNHIDEFLSVNGDGPVVYETLTNMTLVWQ